MGTRGRLMAVVAWAFSAGAALVPAKCLAQESAAPQLPTPSVDQEGCTDPKGLPRLAASSILSCESSDSVEVTVPLRLDAQGVVQEKSVRGSYEFREYRIPPMFQEDQAFQSLTQSFRNVGFTIKYAETPSTITARNQDTWVLITIGGDYYDLKAIRVPVDSWTPIQSAQEIAREMEIHNRAAIYGIEFSPDNQALVENRSKILFEVLAYLIRNPTLAVDVESHLTSRNGSAESDQQVTKRRAEALVAWLEAHGIVAARLRPKAFGRSKPIIEENDTPLEVRRNERVELAKTAP